MNHTLDDGELDADKAADMALTFIISSQHM